MKKRIIIFILIFLLVCPFNVVLADSSDGVNVKSNFLTQTIVDLNLVLGDFFINLVNNIVGEEITIQSLIFNEVEAVDANFFSARITENSMHKVVKDAVNRWYSFFMTLAITIYVGCFLLVGIKSMISESVFSKAKMKDLVMKWLTGITILFVFPYVMKYAFKVNDAIIGMIDQGFTIGKGVSGTYIGGVDEFTVEEVEFRSPQYVSKYTGILTYGGELLNKAYLRRVNDFTNNLDMMRIMRAYAGITGRIIFVIIWFVLLFQLITLLVKYYKRYFIIAVLITIFPLVMIYYLLGLLKGKNSPAFSAWCKEFFVNVFLQAMHAIIYAIIAAVCLDRVKEELATGKGTTLNWLIIVVAINFLFQGEKIVRKILGGEASTAAAIGDSAKRGRAGMKSGMGQAKRVGGLFKK